MMNQFKNLTLLRPLMLSFQSKTDNDTETSETEKTITDHDHYIRYITKQEFNQLAVENFAPRLKEVNVANKSNIGNVIN